MCITVLSPEDGKSLSHFYRSQVSYYELYIAKIYFKKYLNLELRREVIKLLSKLTIFCLLRHAVAVKYKNSSGTVLCVLLSSPQFTEGHVLIFISI